jgi:hypothetical protein
MCRLTTYKQGVCQFFNLLKLWCFVLIFVDLFSFL